VLINGVKYACDRCIRGHRVSNCKHADQPMTMIKPKGRPATQCSHCREARKNRLLHTKCLCGVNHSGTRHAESCPCAMDMSKCTCTKNVTRTQSRSRRSQTSLSRTASVSSVSSSPVTKDDRHDSPIADSASSVRSLDLGPSMVQPIYENDGTETWRINGAYLEFPPRASSVSTTASATVAEPSMVGCSHNYQSADSSNGDGSGNSGYGVPFNGGPASLNSIQALYDPISEQDPSQMFPMAYADSAVESDDLYTQWLEPLQLGNVDSMSSNVSVLSHNDDESLFELSNNKASSSHPDGWSQQPKPILMSVGSYWSEDEAISPRHAHAKEAIVPGFWDYVS